MTIEELLDKLPYRIPGSQANYFYLEVFKEKEGYRVGYYMDNGMPRVTVSHRLLGATLLELHGWCVQNNHLTT